jgi:hypothetical protein
LVPLWLPTWQKAKGTSWSWPTDIWDAFGFTWISVFVGFHLNLRWSQAAPRGPQGPKKLRGWIMLSHPPWRYARAPQGSSVPALPSGSPSPRPPLRFNRWIAE